MRYQTLVAAAVIALGASAASASQVTYDFTWDNGTTYSMVGYFTGEDSDGDNFISDGEISILSFEGFNGGVSMGSTTGDSLSLVGVSGFDFTFDLLAGNFFDGTSGVNGQLWNVRGAGLGFFDGNASASLTLDGSNVAGSGAFDPQAYTATLRSAVPPVPLPAGLPLMAVALGMMGLLRRKRASA